MRYDEICADNDVSKQEVVGSETSGSASPIAVDLLSLVVETVPGEWNKVVVDLKELGAMPGEIFDVIEIYNSNNEIVSLQLDSFLVLPGQENLCPSDEVSDVCNTIRGLLDLPFQSGTFPGEDAQVY